MLTAIHQPRAVHVAKLQTPRGVKLPTKFTEGVYKLPLGLSGMPRLDYLTRLVWISDNIHIYQITNLYSSFLHLLGFGLLLSVLYLSYISWISH